MAKAKSTKQRESETLQSRGNKRIHQNGRPKRMPKWNRRIKAASRGVVKLTPRIKALKAELAHLQRAELHLYNIKFDAQRHVIPVKVVTTKTKRAPAPTITSDQFVAEFSRMSGAQKDTFIRKLREELQ